MKYCIKIITLLTLLTAANKVHSAAAPAQNPIAHYVGQTHTQIAEWNREIHTSKKKASPERIDAIINDIQSRITILKDMVTHPFSHIAPSAPLYTLLRTLEDVKHNLHIGIVFSPNETYTMSVKGNEATIYYALTGALLQTISFDPPQSTNTHQIELAALTNTSVIMLAKSHHNTDVKQWNIQGQYLKTIHAPRDANLQLSQFSIDKNTIFLLVQKKLQLWNIDSQTMTHEFITALQDRINSATLSPKETYIAITARDEKAEIWNLNKKKLMHKIQYSNHNTKHFITFSSDETLFCVIKNRIAYIYNTKDGSLYKQSTPGFTVQQAVFSPTDNNKIMITYEDARIAIWNIHTDNLLAINPDQYNYSAFWSPRGTEIVTVSRNAIQLWNTQTGQLIQTLASDIYASNIKNILFSPKGTYLAISYEIKYDPQAHVGRYIPLYGHPLVINTRIYKIVS